ncbi:hypothetical protein, partial [Mycetohabitans sp. B6]|uniref:hypothetical protein n=1 Tax=Mycetohabitans sp. B6 TaxID=2841843 RepID=UPI001F31F841
LFFSVSALLHDMTFCLLRLHHAGFFLLLNGPVFWGSLNRCQIADVVSRHLVGHLLENFSWQVVECRGPAGQRVNQGTAWR